MCREDATPVVQSEPAHPGSDANQGMSGSFFRSGDGGILDLKTDGKEHFVMMPDPRDPSKMARFSSRSMTPAHLRGVRNAMIRLLEGREGASSGSAAGSL